MTGASIEDTLAPVPITLAMPNHPSINWLEHATSEDGSRWIVVAVRCAKCNRRSFDAQFWIANAREPRNGATFLYVVRRCPGCNRNVRTALTHHRGYPAADGIDGRWVCESCGSFLAEIDAPRGQVVVPCRCKQDVRAMGEKIADSIVHIHSNMMHNEMVVAAAQLAATAPLST